MRKATQSTEEEEVDSLDVREPEDEAQNAVQSDGVPENDAHDHLKEQIASIVDAEFTGVLPDSQPKATEILKDDSSPSSARRSRRIKPVSTLRSLEGETIVTQNVESPKAPDTVLGKRVRTERTVTIDGTCFVRRQVILL